MTAKDRENRIFMAYLKGWLVFAVFLAAAIMLLLTDVAMAKPLKIENGQCPGEKVLEKFKSAGKSEDEGGLFGGGDSTLPNILWLLDPGKVEMKELPFGGAENITLDGKLALHPLDRMKILLVHQDDESRYWLVRVQRRGQAGAAGWGEVLCGWIPTGDDAQETAALNGLLPWNGLGVIRRMEQKAAPGKFRVRGSPIPLKAVVHNLGGEEQIPLYDEPDKDKGKIIRKLHQFEFLDVYAARQDPATKGETAKNKKKYFFLLGRKAVAGRDTDILGWVHEDDIAIWPTRIAVYWTGKGGVATEGPERSEVVLEAPVGKADAGGGVERKYPVLTTNPPAERIAKIAAKKGLNRKKVLKVIKSVKFVAPGQACIGGGGKCISAEEKERLRQAMAEKKEQLKRVDVVFLIDGTSSMKPYFPAVAKGVRDFVQWLNDNRENADISVSVALYGDYRDNGSGPGGVDYERPVPLHDPADDDEAMDDLVQRADGDPIGDVHKDRLEAPFAAIVRVAGDKTRWRKNSGMRYLVHIADNGNRNPKEGRNLPLTDGLKDPVGVMDVVKVLRERGIVYVPIAVPGKKAPVANARFADQSREIAGHLKEDGLSIPLSRVESGPDGTASEVEKVLETAIKVTGKQFEGLKALRACQEMEGVDIKGCTKAALNLGHGFVGRIAGPGIKRLRLDEAVSKNAAYVQRTQPVWAKPVQGGNQVLDFWLMLSPDPADKLAITVKHLCRDFRPGNIVTAQKNLREALGNSANTGAGEDDEDADEASGDEESSTVADGMRRQFFIPAWALAEVFGKPWKKLKKYVDGLGEDGGWKWNRHFCKSAYLLDLAIFKGRKVTDESLIKMKKDEGKHRYVANVPKEKIKKFNWKYDFGDEQVFYFIPLSYLP